LADSVPGRPQKTGLELAAKALFLYVIFVVCPIRYWPLGDNIDQTWRFALNYAHAQGLMQGTEVIFTTGPLGYLCFPQHIGSNLGQALLFQSALWLVLAFVFADLFFRASFTLRNLALFSLCLGLAADLFWFEYMGLENLLLAAALVLLVVYWFRGGVVRLLLALVLVGVLPLIKLTAAMMGFSALLGFLVARVWALGVRKLWGEILLAAIVPASVALGLAIKTMPAKSALMAYLKGSFDTVSGFSSAMAKEGSGFEMAGALFGLALVVAMVLLLKSRTDARFYCLTLAMPLFISFKHGFVRQDPLHVNEFFCFLALAIGLISLEVDLSGRNARRPILFTGLFVALWLANVQSISRTAAESTGLRGLWMTLRAVPLSQLEQRLDATPFPDESRLEPEIVQAIGTAPVASLSIQFSNLAAAGLQTKLYPVVQRYAAYTPYLDSLNAAWIRDKGPRFLVFDGDRLDVRNSWAETPAMWLEVYKWYDLLLLGPKNLLLERRRSPRFSSLKVVQQTQTDQNGSFQLTPVGDAVFWKMNCDSGLKRQIEKTLFRGPLVFMNIHRANGTQRRDRVIPVMLATPVLGNYLPGSLRQYARLFEGKVSGADIVDQISIDHSRNCSVELLAEIR
jgi:hypothetical protein